MKSLLGFGQRTGYLPLNVGAAVKLPPRRDVLPERILTEADVHRLRALESRPARWAALHTSARSTSGAGDQRRSVT